MPPEQLRSWSALHNCRGWVRGFGLITQRAIRRGNFLSIQALIIKTEPFVAACNRSKGSFNRSATANSILENLQGRCQQISGT